MQAVMPETGTADEKRRMIVRVHKSGRQAPVDLLYLFRRYVIFEPIIETDTSGKFPGKELRCVVIGTIEIDVDIAEKAGLSPKPGDVTDIVDSYDDPCISLLLSDSVDMLFYRTEVGSFIELDRCQRQKPYTVDTCSLLLDGTAPRQWDMRDAVHGGLRG
jgi:hypothetical protein